MNKNVTKLVVAAWIICASVRTAAAAPEQSAKGSVLRETAETPSPAKSETAKLSKTVFLARNTSPKAKPAASTAATKPPVVESRKKTVGHYWRQLMSTFREVNHANRNKK